MSFSVNSLNSLGKDLLSIAATVRNKVKRSRVERGQLAPVPAARRAARQGKQKVLQAIAGKAQEGDRLAQIELKHRRGYFR